MDFLNKGNGIWFPIRFSSFLLYRNCKRLREFEEIGISRQSCRDVCKYHLGKLLRLLSGFRPRIRPLGSVCHILWCLLSRPKEPPFSRLFNFWGQRRVHGCGGTEQRVLKARALPLIAIFPRHLSGKVWWSMICTLMEAYFRPITIILHLISITFELFNVSNIYSLLMELSLWSPVDV